MRTHGHEQVVKQRGESMAAAAKTGKPHGMLSVIGLDDAALEGICERARAKIGSADTVCRLANYLFPTGRVVSGHKDALAVVRCGHLLIGGCVLGARTFWDTLLAYVPVRRLLLECMRAC